MTMPKPVPLITFVPKTKDCRILYQFDHYLLMSRVFSMGKLSPVKDDWETNKSLDWIKRKSAGIISPADSWTKSPHTTSSIEFPFASCHE